MTRRFPGLQVTTEQFYYPVTTWSGFSSQVLPKVGFAFLLSALFIEQNPSSNRLVRIARPQRVIGPIGLAMIIYGGLRRQTGAFEVVLDDEVIFSKFQEKRFPTVADLQYSVGRRLSDSGS